MLRAVRLSQGSLRTQIGIFLPQEGGNFPSFSPIQKWTKSGSARIWGATRRRGNWALKRAIGTSIRSASEFSSWSTPWASTRDPISSEDQKIDPRPSVQRSIRSRVLSIWTFLLLWRKMDKSSTCPSLGFQYYLIEFQYFPFAAPFLGSSIGMEVGNEG